MHLVGVDPALHRQGVAGALYRRFAEQVAQRGARRLACLTSPGNTTSLRFHRGLGFTVVPGDDVVECVPVHRDHDGPGLHRVLFTRPSTTSGRLQRRSGSSEGVCRSRRASSPLTTASAAASAVTPGHAAAVQARPARLPNTEEPA